MWPRVQACAVTPGGQSSYYSLMAKCRNRNVGCFFYCLYRPTLVLFLLPFWCKQPNSDSLITPPANLTCPFKAFYKFSNLLRSVWKVKARLSDLIFPFFLYFQVKIFHFTQRHQKTKRRQTRSTVRVMLPFMYFWANSNSCVFKHFRRNCVCLRWNLRPQI